MKIKTFVAILFTMISSSVFSQVGNNVVERSFACSVNSGYTINDVISAMRQNDCEEGSNPGVVILREAVAVSGEFQMDWDFVVRLDYPSYTDMIERRVAFRNQSGGGTEGQGELSRALEDMEKIINDLQNNNVNEETFDKGEKLYNKLLNHQKATKEKGMDKNCLFLPVIHKSLVKPR